MRSRTAAVIAVVALLAAGCGGDSGPQEQTEEAAAEATRKAIRGTFVNNSGDVIDFMNAECREQVDESEIKQALALAQVFFQDDSYDLADIEVRATVTEFSPEAATVDIELIAPEGADLGLLELSDDTVDVVYENGKWVGEECDFADSSESDLDDLEEALAELGIAGTRDDPVPARQPAPVGSGFTVMIDRYEPDAFALIEELGGSEPFIDDGQVISLVAYDIGYSGDDEPANVGSLQLQLVGSDGVAIDQTGCGNIDNQLFYGTRQVFSGAVTSAVSCFAADPDRFAADPVLSIEAGFTGRPVFFAPLTEASSPGEITGTTGPSPDSALTDDRNDPAPLGTAVDIGDGWTLTVNRADTDAADVLAAASEFNEPARDGYSYVLVDLTLAYDGDETSQSLFSVDIGMVGDSNVAADDQCNLSEIPDELDRFSDVFPGGSASGAHCFLAPTADLDSLVVYAEGEVFDDEPDFFAIR